MATRKPAAQRRAGTHVVTARYEVVYKVAAQKAAAAGDCGASRASVRGEPPEAKGKGTPGRDTNAAHQARGWCWSPAWPLSASCRPSRRESVSGGALPSETAPFWLCNLAPRLRVAYYAATDYAGEVSQSDCSHQKR